jgi:phenylalanine-4-hydroxylase
MTGETDHKLRGDYSRMRPDYTFDQDWDAYRPAEHEHWRRLYARQALARGPSTRARSSTPALAVPRLRHGIPRFDAINEKLGARNPLAPRRRSRARARPRFFEHLAKPAASP